MFKEYLTKTGRLSKRQPQEVKNQWYVQKCIKTHGDTYDYSKLVFTGANGKVIVTCKLHGDFTQRLDQHIQGQKCPECIRLQKTKTKEEQIAEFHKVHGNRYDYSRVEYTNIDTNVSIICSTHGVFSQTPYCHLNGSGCPKCQHKYYTTIYLVKCLITGLIKIGITKSIKSRIPKIGGRVSLIQQYKCEDPRSLEKLLHENYKAFNRFNNTVTNGGTEFFQLSDAQVDEIQQFITSSGGDILL